MNHRSTRLAHERLDAYRVSLELYRGIEAVARAFPRGYADLKDQIRRSTSSMVCNIAEGANRALPRDKAARFTLARAECCEAAAVLDMAEASEIVDRTASDRLHVLADRVAAMLTGLIRRENGRLPP